MMPRASLGIVAAATVVAMAPQQRATPRRLGAPTATLDIEFTGIDGVRELRDGRVIVLDARERVIQVADARLSTAKPIGRDGDGPGEFRLPRALLSLGGDTTLVNDMARFGKLLVITPQGAMGGFVSTVDNTLGTRTFVVSAADAAGRFYENSYGRDSNAIVRWDRARHRRDTLAHLSMKVSSPLLDIKPTARNAPPGAAQRSGGPVPPFATVSQWAVSADGRVAIVTPVPYRVTMISAAGARVQGPAMTVAPVPVGAAEKAVFKAERQRPVPTLTFANGKQTASYRTPAYAEPAEWPATLSAFLPNAVSYASDGLLWVKRATRAGAPPLYDVFDATAKLAYQLELPAHTTLAGFGVGSVYLARVDDNDVHVLQRYTLPKP
jgi:hypothetical protein